MKLHVFAMAAAGALLWGVLVMLFVGVANLWFPGYGQAVLNFAASIYPGYDASATVGQVGLGTLYGLLDGACIGALFAWMYNRLVR